MEFGRMIDFMILRDTRIGDCVRGRKDSWSEWQGVVIGVIYFKTGKHWIIECDGLHFIKALDDRLPRW